MLLSVRLAVFLKTMAGQAGESGSRGGKKTMNSSIQLWVFFPWSARQEQQQQLASVMWLLKRPAGFGEGVGAESGRVECTRVREKSEIDGCLHYHIHP